MCKTSTEAKASTMTPAGTASALLFLWIATADSKRPGHVVGPYPTTAAFVDDYAEYRRRRIVAFTERESFERETHDGFARETRGTQLKDDAGGPEPHYSHLR
jgi:hypothetical protein